MREKRFETKLRMVIDNEKNFGVRVLNPEEIVELLNSFYEENKSLKQEILLLREYKEHMIASENGLVK